MTDLDERLEILAKIIVDETRLKFTDDVCIEVFARAIIQIIRIQLLGKE